MFYGYLSISAIYCFTINFKVYYYILEISLVPLKTQMTIHAIFFQTWGRRPWPCSQIVGASRQSRDPLRRPSCWVWSHALYAMSTVSTLNLVCCNVVCRLIRTSTGSKNRSLSVSSISCVSVAYLHLICVSTDSVNLRSCSSPVFPYTKPNASNRYQFGNPVSNKNIIDTNLDLNW